MGLCLIFTIVKMQGLNKPITNLNKRQHDISLAHSAPTAPGQVDGKSLPHAQFASLGEWVTIKCLLRVNMIKQRVIL